LVRPTLFIKSVRNSNFAFKLYLRLFKLPQNYKISIRNQSCSIWKVNMQYYKASLHANNWVDGLLHLVILTILPNIAWLYLPSFLKDPWLGLEDSNFSKVFQKKHIFLKIVGITLPDDKTSLPDDSALVYRRSSPSSYVIGKCSGTALWQFSLLSSVSAGILIAGSK